MDQPLYSIPKAIHIRIPNMSFENIAPENHIFFIIHGIFSEICMVCEIDIFSNKMINQQPRSCLSHIGHLSNMMN